MTVILRSEGNHPGEDQDANGEFPEETGECGQLKWDDYVRLLGGNEGPRSGWLTEAVSVIFGKAVYFGAMASLCIRALLQIVNRVLHSMRINKKHGENTKWTTVSSYFAVSWSYVFDEFWVKMEI